MTIAPAINLESHTTVRIIMVSRDTKKKQQQQQNKQTNKQKQNKTNKQKTKVRAKFLAYLSHDYL